MAKTKRIERTFNPLETSLIKFTEVATGDEVEFDAAEIVGGKAVYDKLPDMGKRFLLHGVNAKLGDVAASSEKGVAEIKETIENIRSGSWSSRSGGGGARITVMAEAMHSVLSDMAKAKGTEAPTLDSVVDRLQALSVEDRKAVPEQFPQVKSKMAEIAAARAQEKAKKAKAATKGAEMPDLSAFFGTAAE